MNSNERLYQNTPNKQYWEEFLERKLTMEEVQLLNSTKCEYNINMEIKKIYDYVSTEGLYIPELTHLNGNCLFESLKYFKLCDDIDELRIGLSKLMLIFKDVKNFFPDQEESLNELFCNFNEVQYVYCSVNKKVYKYNYEAMCIDLATNGNWDRLITELILRVLSMVFNLRFLIYRNVGNSVNICVDKNVLTKDIYLGQIDDFHYIPLDVRKGHNNENDFPRYTDKYKLFTIWATTMSNNKYQQME